MLAAANKAFERLTHGEQREHLRWATRWFARQCEKIGCHDCAEPSNKPEPVKKL